MKNTLHVWCMRPGMQLWPSVQRYQVANQTDRVLSRLKRRRYLFNLTNEFQNYYFQSEKAYQFGYERRFIVGFAASSHLRTKLLGSRRRCTQLLRAA